jgi:hypothetical protein
VTRGPIFDRSVQLEWLNESLRLRGDAGGAARAALDMWMRDRIQSDIGREKTVRILSRIWLEPHADVAHLVAWGAEQTSAIGDPRPLHIGAMIMTHPFFGDACAAVGRQLALGPVVHTNETTRRLRRRWGDREVVHVGVKSVVRTRRSLGFLEGEPGRTASTAAERLEAPGILTQWLAHALVIARGSSEIDAQGLRGSPEIFMLDLEPLQPNGYPFGDVFEEGGGRRVFRTRPSPAHASRRSRQASLPGMA